MCSESDDGASFSCSSEVADPPRTRRASAARRRAAPPPAPRSVPVPPPPRCWLCEYHTHPLAQRLHDAALQTVRSATVDSLADMISEELTSAQRGDGAQIGEAYSVGAADVARHFAEHVVDARVQLPYMIRSLQRAYAGLRGGVRGCADDGSGDVYVDKSDVDAMVKISSQLVALYRYDETVSVRGIASGKP